MSCTQRVERERMNIKRAITFSLKTLMNANLLSKSIQDANRARAALLKKQEEEEAARRAVRIYTKVLLWL